MTGRERLAAAATLVVLAGVLYLVFAYKPV